MFEKRTWPRGRRREIEEMSSIVLVFFPFRISAKTVFLQLKHIWSIYWDVPQGTINNGEKSTTANSSHTQSGAMLRLLFRP